MEITLQKWIVNISSFFLRISSKDIGRAKYVYLDASQQKYHDDITKGKEFPLHWSIVQVISQLPVDYPHHNFDDVFAPA